MFNFHFRERTNTWPGFVDLFSNLVIILIFLLIVFVFLWTTTSVFNTRTGAKTVAELRAENAAQAKKIKQMELDDQEATRRLVLARNELENNSEAMLEKDLSIVDLVSAYEGAVTKLQADNQMKLQQIHELTDKLTQAALQQKSATDKLEQERQQIQSALDAQRAEIEQERQKIQAALDAAEEKSRAQQVEYVEMSTRLNKALADKVAELQSAGQYQSAFYRAIKTALGDSKSVETDGDRFIISSDILFDSGSYTISAEGKKQLRMIANVIKDFENKIPTDIDWIVRVDGHTDKRAVIPGTRAYRNNLQLSMLRAASVAKELVNNGVSQRRLLPTGFGSMHPVSLGGGTDDLQKNRRIELQLTNR